MTGPSGSGQKPLLWSSKLSWLQPPSVRSSAFILSLIIVPLGSEEILSNALDH